MNVKEYLGQYIKAQKYAQECIDRLDAALCIGPKSSVIDGMPKSAPEGDLSDIVAKIDSIRRKADAARKRALDLMDEISDVIEAVPNQEDRVLLRQRYIYGLKWEEVAQKMHYSLQSVYRLHWRALRSVKMKDESK